MKSKSSEIGPLTKAMFIVAGAVALVGIAFYVIFSEGNSDHTVGEIWISKSNDAIERGALRSNDWDQVVLDAEELINGISPNLIRRDGEEYWKDLAIEFVEQRYKSRILSEIGIIQDALESRVISLGSEALFRLSVKVDIDPNEKEFVASLIFLGEPGYLAALSLYLCRYTFESVPELWEEVDSIVTENPEISSIEFNFPVVDHPQKLQWKRLKVFEELGALRK